MRFIHTSDWHAGRTFRNYERYDEFQALLEEMGSFAEKEAIDLIIIAGDLFDHPTPPAEAEKIVYSFFCRMNKAAIPVLVIAGNHDSYDRFDSRTELFSIANVTVVGKPRKDAIHRFQSKRGENVIVASLPFLSPRLLLKADEIFELAESEMKTSYSDQVGRIIERLSREFTGGAINILATHLFAQGAIPSYSERPIDISNAYAVGTPAIPTGASYVALGHIHKRQKLPRTEAAYYSGSLMKLDFGEEKDEKGFLVVEAMPNLPAQVDYFNLQSVKPVLTVDVPYPELQQRAEEIRKYFGNAYGRVRITNDQPVANLREIVKHEIPEAVECEFILTGEREQKRAPVELSQLTDPVEMFHSFYREEHGKEPPEQYTKAMKKLYEEAVAASEQEEDGS